MPGLRDSAARAGWRPRSPIGRWKSRGGGRSPSPPRWLLRGSAQPWPHCCPTSDHRPARRSGHGRAPAAWRFWSLAAIARLSVLPPSRTRIEGEPEDRERAARAAGPCRPGSGWRAARSPACRAAAACRHRPSRRPSAAGAGSRRAAPAPRRARLREKVSRRLNDRGEQDQRDHRQRTRGRTIPSGRAATDASRLPLESQSNQPRVMPPCASLRQAMHDEASAAP